MKKTFLLLALAFVPFLVFAEYSDYSAKKTYGTEKKICTKEYDPVCGKTTDHCITKSPCKPIYKTYPNKCTLYAAKAHFVSFGACEQKEQYYQQYEKPEYKKKSAEISGEIKGKLDAWLARLEQKVSSSSHSNDEKIERLYKLKERLAKMGEKRPKLWPAINYLKEGVYEIIQDLENNLDDLDSLLEDLF